MILAINYIRTNIFAKETYLRLYKILLFSVIIIIINKKRDWAWKCGTHLIYLRWHRKCYYIRNKNKLAISSKWLSKRTIWQLLINCYNIDIEIINRGYNKIFVNRWSCYIILLLAIYSHIYTAKLKFIIYSIHYRQVHALSLRCKR